MFSCLTCNDKIYSFRALKDHLWIRHRKADCREYIEFEDETKSRRFCVSCNSVYYGGHINFCIKCSPGTERKITVENKVTDAKPDDATQPKRKFIAVAINWDVTDVGYKSVEVFPTRTKACDDVVGKSFNQTTSQNKAGNGEKFVLIEISADGKVTSSLYEAQKSYRRLDG